MEGTFASSLDVRLFNSSFNGDIEGVVAALAQGARVTMRSPGGFTPLLVTAQEGHTDTRVAKCQIFYTDQNLQTRFYPEKSA